MALTIAKGRRPIRRFLVYDLEWIPGTMRVRVAGVYDGNQYRCYNSVESFLNAELTSKNRGVWFYAHAGGLADIQFVLESALGRYQVEASFSGSSAIICKLKQGKNVWTFVDSYWLLRAPLDKIATWVGMEKGEAEKRLTEDEAREFYATCPLPDLILYNQLDCIILYTAIREFQQRILQLGGQLQKTQASCAMHLFRRRFLKNRLNTGAVVNDIARQAYFASRVEVFTRYVDSARYYDINSSFPSAMTKVCPGEVVAMGKRLPNYGIYLADVEIETPDSYMPPLPTRLEGRLFFPLGEWRSWLSSVDIELLQREGGRVLKVHKVIEFAPFRDLRDYALELYELRRREADGFSKAAYKLLLNSLYGKFAESPVKSRLLIDPEVCPSTPYLRPGVWIQEQTLPIPHMHVPISVHITALARKAIYDYMKSADEVYYCDTDGFATNSELTTTDRLGGLKLEKLLRGGEFVAPKMYRLDGTDEKGNELTDDVSIKAKGFSRMTPEKWEALVIGDEIEYTRMLRVKELARSGKFQPREEVITKRIKNAIPKRHTYPDGETRPWHLKELKQLLG